MRDRPVRAAERLPVGGPSGGCGTFFPPPADASPAPRRSTLGLPPPAPLDSGFYMRVFCTQATAPALGAMLDYLAAQDILLSPAGPEAEGAGSGAWESATLSDAQGGDVSLQCSRDDGSGECLLRQEVNEFLRRVGPGRLSPTKHKVIRHLKGTRMIIACKIPPGRAIEGLPVHQRLLHYFASRCDGLIQIDGQGFFDRNKRILDIAPRRR